VTTNALHPGLVSSGIGANNRGWYWRLTYFFIDWIGRTPGQGADTIIYLATAPELAGVTGQYFYERKPLAPSAAARDPAAARRLWEVSAQLTGLTAGAA
jgi:hypothetical protein